MREIRKRLKVQKVLRDGPATKTFLATDTWSKEERQIVVKVFPNGQFRNERTEAHHVISGFSGVRHERLIPIIEAGLTKSGDLYSIREYVPGTKLISPDIQHFQQLISTVLFLNSIGFVHGNIKPANIFVLDTGLKLSDPILVQPLRRNDSAEEVRFCSPELLAGMKPMLESDLYSVGAVLYRWIIGHEPFMDSAMNLLKLKYMLRSCDVGVDKARLTEKLPHVVLGLLHKDPQKRIQAVRALELIELPATRAPFAGRTDLLEQIRNAIADRSKQTLRTFVMEAPTGMGKSRFAEELNLACSLDPVKVGVCNCAAQPGLTPITNGINSLIRSLTSSNHSLRKNVAALSTTLMPSILGDEIQGSNSNPIERIASDLVSALAVLAHVAPFALVIEDIDRAHPAVLSFVEQLCIRASELPVVVLITCRAFSRQSQVESLLNRLLGADFHRIQLTQLNNREVRAVLTALSSNRSDYEEALYFSCGNPLFLEEYAASGAKAVPRSILEAMKCVTSNSREDAQIAAALSLFSRPVRVEFVARIRDQNKEGVMASLYHLEALGLITRTEEGVRLYPSVRHRINQSIASKRRTILSRRAFEVMRTSEHPKEDVAQWAFDGQHFIEAAALYRQIAHQSFESRNYKRAAFFYEQIRKCAQHGAADLNCDELEKNARCYRSLARFREARHLYQTLLSSDFIQNSPESLSRIYALLGWVSDKRSPEVHIALARKSIAVLPDTSRDISTRYAQLCIKLLQVGDLSGTIDALTNAEKHDPEGLNASVTVAKASLYLNEGRFRNACEYFDVLQKSVFDKAGVVMNLGFCFEHLGYLHKASALFKKADRLSYETSNVSLQVASVGNRGCVATKMGRLLEAQSFFKEAFDRLGSINRLGKDFDRNNFMSLYADTAAHHVQTADFKGAAELLCYLKPSKGWAFTFDRLHCELVRCDFWAAMGRLEQVEAMLRSLESRPLFKSPFFQAKKSIVLARVNRHDRKGMFSPLTDALAAAEKLGTLYLQCEVLNELAQVSLDRPDKALASRYAKQALGLAQRNHYRLLGARAQLLFGMATEIQSQKQRYLYGAFQEASEMGLRELVAESAYEIGAFQLSLKNWVTAQEYLMRCISVVEEIADGVPEKHRAGYLNLSPHRKALQALKVCNPEVQKLLYVKSVTPDFGNEKRYFSGLYQLTAAGGSSTTVEAAIGSIADTLAATLSRDAVVTIRYADRRITKAVKPKQPEELIRRAEKFIGKTKDRIHLGATETKPYKPIAWIPLEGAGWEGGIYIECGAHDPTFTEREIEFLTMVGSIGSSALSTAESRKHEEAKRNISGLYGIVGSSKSINTVFSQIQVASSNNASVLIEGESGTGKELVAKAIHAESARAKQPFIAVDCGAMPESLIEAELFGAKKGSYTGADADRAGLFEAAHRGTIFLDEISNTTPAVQAKLLRVLQEREVRRLGETKGRPVDARLIVASNQDLEGLVESGAFRKDLLYRLKVLYIKVPSLRSRRDDIPMLARSFLHRLNTTNRAKKYFAEGVVERLSTYSFPGNVRELQNAVERAFFSANGTTIDNIPLDAQTDEAPAAGEDVRSWFNDLSEGRKDFWSAVHNRYKKRDISRERVLALIDFGLRCSKGNYKSMAAKLRLKERDYRRFMDFLRRSDCLLDFRPYRKITDASES